jgi:hypothetical protein
LMSSVSLLVLLMVKSGMENSSWGRFIYRRSRTNWFRLLSTSQKRMRRIMYQNASRNALSTRLGKVMWVWMEAHLVVRAKRLTWILDLRVGRVNCGSHE